MKRTHLFALICFYLLFFYTKSSQAQSSYYSPLAVSPYIGSAAGVFNEKPPFSCGTDHLHQQRLQHDEQYRKRLEDIEKAYQERVEAGDLNAKNMTCPNGVVTIPIVIHVVYGDDASGNPLPVGTGENLSVADIQLGVDYLNRAFAGIPLCSNDPPGEDIGIQYCLAKRDINNMPSNGITRHYDPNLTDLDKCTESAMLKALSQVSGSPNVNPWPSTDYINVWLVKEICSPCSPSGCGVAGYSTLAGSHGSAADGFVNEADLWSSTCHSAKVGVHELGHYWNLYHTFQGGCTNGNCLTDGDRVCDTPPDTDSNPGSNCSAVNTCNTDTPDLNDLRNNYMDYGQLACMNSFTPGQKTRMIDALCNVRSSLMESAGCLDPCPSPITAGFTYTPPNPVIGTSVNFTNTSTNASGYEWFINGTSFSTNMNDSYTFNIQGTYEICMTAASNNADCLPQEHCENIRVECYVGASFTTNVSDIDPGDMVDFTNTTVGATSYEWFVDGASQGTTMDLLSHPFPNIGGYSVYLVACDAVCCDTSEVSFINVGSCSSGKQGAIWYFGSNAGLDFNTNPPTPLLGGQINTVEGCATISDNNGNLLFYTDGITIWDATHTAMPNGTGLLGNPSSAQSGIIVPQPGNANIYFIFTVAVMNNAAGLQYSVVDMTLNAGFGDVTIKNVPLPTTPSAEKITVVQHCNGQDYWVVSHANNSSNFDSYLMSTIGVNPVPVVSTVGSNLLGGGAEGYLKASPDGRKLATAFLTGSFFELYDFNNTTGVISNAITLTVPNCISAYGVEFSPDGTKLYGTCFSNEVYQFDLSAGSPTAIITSGTVVHTYSGINTGASLQLAIDGKIYIAELFASTLGTINFPNNLGVACTVVENSTPLGTGTTSTLGLPNIFPNFFIDQKPYISGDTLACIGDEFTYTTTKGGVCDAATYQFIHSGNATITAQVDTSITLMFTQTGIDTLFMVKESACQDYFDTLVIQTNPNPTFAWMDSDTLLCPGQGGIISFSTNADSVVLTNTASGYMQTLMGNIHGFPAPSADSCYVLQLINTQTMCDALVNFCVTVSAPCCPSSVGDFSSTEYRCATDPAARPANVPILADVIATLDVNADDKTFTWIPNINDTIMYTGNNCDPQIFEYELIVGCINDPNLALSAGVITVVVYPNISASNNVIIGDSTCEPTLNVECSNYTVTNDIDNNGTTPNYAGLSVGTVTFTVTNPAAQANGVNAACISQDYVGNYIRAEAGVLDAPDDLCPGDPITATTSDPAGNLTHQTLAGYSISYLLIDASTNVIVDVQTNPVGNMASFTPPSGDYVVCSYNELPINPPIPSPLTTPLGTLNHADIGSQHEGCFDQSCKNICVPEPLIVACNQSVSQGNAGGISPFYFNIHEICIEGGKQPYNFIWSTSGFVRHGIVGDGHIRIIHADNALWNVTVVDAHGCDTDVNGNPLVFGSAGNPLILSIYNYTVSPATINNGCQNGSLSVYAQGGDGNYTFTWSGPATWTVPSPATGNGSAGGGTNNVYNMSNLPSGWYSVTVTDGVGETTSGWYWLPCSVPGRGKQADFGENIQAYPNPFSEQIIINYTLDKQSVVELNIFDMAGRNVGNILNNKQQEVGRHQQVWDAGQLPPGIYYYRLQIDGAVYSDKIVKF